MVIQPGRIREARLAAGLSQDGLAHKAGTSERNIRRWETGQNAPRAESVMAIAEATGHEVTFFFADGDQPDENGALRDQARELVAPFQRRDGRRTAGRVSAARREPGSDAA